MRVLVVDDERPIADELAYLLKQDERIGEVVTTSESSEALRVLTTTDVDAVFLDIRMPGLDGLDIARVLRRFPDPPSIVFVTAYEEHGVEAFDLRALDYIIKPARSDRIAEAVNRVAEARDATAAARAKATTGDDPTTELPAVGAEPPAGRPTEPGKIAVELGGVTRFISISDVRYVEAHGDYARLITATGRHLVRVPLAVLEEQWKPYGFVRIHRSWLVEISAIDEVRHENGRMSLIVGNDVLEVARRHTREVRDLIVRAARPGR